MNACFSCNTIANLCILNDDNDSDDSKRFFLSIELADFLL